MRLRRTACLLAVTALAAAGCSSGGGTKSPAAGAGFQTVTDTPAAKGPLPVLNWSLYAEPQTLDYAFAWDYPVNTVVTNVCEQLYRLTPDMKITPGLAEKTDRPDPLTYVYNLRSGVTFHSGAPMTADDVVASLKRHMDPELGSAWGSAFSNVASIGKTGPLQVTVKLSKPDVLFDETLAASAGTVESAAFLDKAGKDYGNPQTGVDCTGPFSLEKWSPGADLTLKKNAVYWDPALVPRAERVRFSFIGDPAARTNALTTGAVDGGYLLPSNTLPKLQAGGAGKVYFGHNTGNYLLAVTNLQGPLGDLKVRQALSLAVDRPGLVKAALGGFGKPAKAPTPQSAWGTAGDKAAGYFAALPELKQDTAAAKKLIEEAGATGKKLVLVTSPIAPEISVTANAVQAAGKAIGLDIELKTVSPDAYTALFTNPEERAGVDLLVTNGYDNTPDPLEFYKALHTGDFANYGDWSSPEYDTLFDQATGTADPAARADLTAKLQEIAVRELPAIPLVELPYTMYMSNKVTGATPSLASLYYPWAATVGAAG